MSAKTDLKTALEAAGMAMTVVIVGKASSPAVLSWAAGERLRINAMLDALEAGVLPKDLDPDAKAKLWDPVAELKDNEIAQRIHAAARYNLSIGRARFEPGDILCGFNPKGELTYDIADAQLECKRCLSAIDRAHPDFLSEA